MKELNRKFNGLVEENDYGTIHRDINSGEFWAKMTSGRTLSGFKSHSECFKNLVFETENKVNKKLCKEVLTVRHGGGSSWYPGELVYSHWYVYNGIVYWEDTTSGAMKIADESGPFYLEEDKEALEEHNKEFVKWQEVQNNAVEKRNACWKRIVEIGREAREIN